MNTTTIWLLTQVFFYFNGAAISIFYMMDIVDELVRMFKHG